MAEEYARFGDLIDLEKLGKMNVAVVGCGRMGHPIAVLLNQQGVACSTGQLILVDGDVVEDHNRAGSFFDADHVGMNKAHATAWKIQRYKAWSDEEARRRIGCVPKNIHHGGSGGSFQIVESLYRRGVAEEKSEYEPAIDLFILAADDPKVMRELSDYNRERIPILRATFSERADMAEVTFSIPGITPRSFTAVRDSDDREVLHEAHALPADTFSVAVYVTKVAVEILLGLGGTAKGVELGPGVEGHSPIHLVKNRNAQAFEGDAPDNPTGVWKVRLEETLPPEVRRELAADVAQRQNQSRHRGQPHHRPTHRRRRRF